MTASIGFKRGSGGISQTRWRHIVPVVFLLYTISYLDRVNIGMALPSLSKDLGLTPTQSGFVGGVFFWGYIIGCFSAGWLVPRFGAKRIVLYALVTWGLFAIGTGLSYDFHALVIMRFLLGLAEGPVWTSVAALLSQWFLVSERGRAFAFWNLSLPVGALLSGPLSGLLLSYTSWHVMLVLEGLPAWIWAVVWWRSIPNGLDQADWLPSEERQHLQKGLAAEQAKFGVALRSTDWRGMWRHPVVWLVLGAEAALLVVMYGFGLWLPSVIKTASAMKIGSVGLLSALPYLASVIGLVLISESSDRFRERRLHAAVPLITVGILLFAGSHISQSLIVIQMVLFTLAGFFMFVTLPLISAMLVDMLPRAHVAPAIAFTGGVSNLFGGFVGPLMVGWLKSATGSFSLAFSMLGAFGLVGGIFILAVRVRMPVSGETHDDGVTGAVALKR